MNILVETLKILIPLMFMLTIVGCEVFEEEDKSENIVINLENTEGTEINIVSGDSNSNNNTDNVSYED